jgi:hypothetical protein
MERRTPGTEREAATEEGMARVGDLDLGHVRIGWVVEAGIQVRGRFIT